MRVTVTPGADPVRLRGRQGRPVLRREPGPLGARPAARRDDPGDVPAAGAPARVRGLREQRLPGRHPRASRQGAGDHHRLDDRTSASSARSRTATWSTSRTSSPSPSVVIEQPESLVPRERIAIEYTRAVMADFERDPRRRSSGSSTSISATRRSSSSRSSSATSTCSTCSTTACGVRYHGEYSVLKVPVDHA